MDTKELFRKLTGFEPYDYQVRTWEAIERIMREGGKVVIEVPTAGGKTEAAVVPFLSAVYRNTWPVARLIYVLPTRSLVEKQAERIRKLVSGILQLRGKSEEEAEKLAEKLVVVEYGLERTHAFLGWIVVTTWDSFLYGLAAHRTVGNRFTFPAGAIAQSLIIFDEVQMYQDESMYMPRLLSLVVGVLEKANVPVVVMSATIPSKLKEMITGKAETITVERVDKKGPSRGNVGVRVVEGEVEDVLDDIRGALKEGRKVLVVRNTVAKAVETYELLKGQLAGILNPSEILLLHGRFTLRDRRKKEEAIESARLIVSTQVIEAGLDLSNIGLVVTDIAPLDALIQRIGRCARRPGESGKGIILVPVEENISPERTVRGFNGLEKKLQGKDVVFATINNERKIREKYGGKVAEITYKVEKINEPSKKSRKKENNEETAYVGDINNTKTILGEKKGKRKPQLPSGLYVLPYSAVPYDPLVLLTTYDELDEIGEYLADTEKAREALDRVYRFHYENNIVPREFASAYVYFRGLKLFSAPPEYELRSRPELYVMLYPTALEEVEELETGRIIRVSYNRKKLEEWRKKGIVTGRLEPWWDKKKQGIMGWKVRKGFRPAPYGIYALNPEYYSPEKGFVLGLSMDEENIPSDDTEVLAQNTPPGDSGEKSKGKKRSGKKGKKTRQATLLDLGVVR